MFPLFIGELIAHLVGETVIGAFFEGVWKRISGSRRKRQDGELEIDWDAIDAAEEDDDRPSD
jgi:uncharacterized membrane protein